MAEKKNTSSPLERQQSKNAIRQQIATLYRDKNEEVRDLARRFNYSLAHIRAILRQTGVQLRPPVQPACKITLERIEIILSVIRDGGKIGEAFRRGEVGVTQFYEWIKKGRAGKDPLCIYLVTEMDKAFDGVPAASRGARIYSVDERFFDSVDTEEKAWLLGFIATDGHVGDGELAIKLAVKDREILVRIKDILRTDVEIRTRQASKPTKFIVNGRERIIAGGQQSELRICSQRLCNSLRALGMSPNKTWTVKPWDGPEGLMADYYRGVIDGDGTICTEASNRPHRKPNWVVSLCGNESMVSGFRDFVQKRTGKSGFLYELYDGFFRVRFAGTRQAKAVASLLYSKATISLHRKAALAKICLSKPTLPDWSWVTLDYLDCQRKNSSSWSEVAKTLGLSREALCGLRQRLRSKINL